MPRILARNDLTKDGPATNCTSCLRCYNTFMLLVPIILTFALSVLLLWIAMKSIGQITVWDYRVVYLAFAAPASAQVTQTVRNIGPTFGLLLLAGCLAALSLIAWRTSGGLLVSSISEDGFEEFKQRTGAISAGFWWRIGVLRLDAGGGTKARSEALMADPGDARYSPGPLPWLLGLVALASIARAVF